MDNEIEFLKMDEDLKCRLFINGVEVKLYSVNEQRLDGEEALRMLDAAGSGWIREMLDDVILDAEVVE